MRSFTLTTVSCAVLGLAALALVALHGCGRGDGGAGGPGGAGGERLVVYSPHSTAIRAEFERAFNAFRQSQGRAPAKIDWPDAGGASSILQQIQDKNRRNIHDVDVIFGGGTIHDQLKTAGLLQPYKLPEELLAKLPKTIAGLPLYDPDYHWYGAAISSFGLICNKKLIADKKLPAVAEWSDMARPELLGLVGVVDASQSGSVRKAYEIILQAYGYERGMQVLMLMGANARGIGRSSSEVPKDCAQGFIALGACIDFYAYRQMMSPGGDALGFVLPKGLTVVNTDPIAILRGAPHQALAEEFVQFVMSPAGQRLWSYKQGAPGGPQAETLGRYCVLPEIYANEAANLVPGLTSPFDSPPNTFYDGDKEATRIEILPSYLKAMMVDNKRLLTEAWTAVVKAGAPAALVAELTKPLVTEDEMSRLAKEVWAPVKIAADAASQERSKLQAEQESRSRQRSDIELQWSEKFRQLYQTVAAKAQAAPAKAAS